MTTERSLPINLTTLTPIWTGGVDGKSDRLHITGIIGSLRWWYEVFVRSVGGTAYDPTEHSCSFDKSKPNNGLCDVCGVFGATGWSRRFKLILSEARLQQKKPSASSPGREGNFIFNLSPDHPSRGSQGHRWYLPGEPLDGQVQLTVIPVAPPDKSNNYFSPNIIGSLLQFIADRASLGAKPQMGMGVVRLADRLSLLPLLNHLKQIDAGQKNKKEVNTRLPCLQNMFFATIHVKSATEADTFNLKYDLRSMFREVYQGNDNLRHTIMGYVRGERIGAKIMMSYPYDNGTIRIWGWIPGMNQAKPSRNDILNGIYGFLEDTYGQDNFSFWLDYDPERNGTVLNYLEQYVLKGAE